MMKEKPLILGIVGMMTISTAALAQPGSTDPSDSTMGTVRSKLESGIDSAADSVKSATGMGTPASSEFSAADLNHDSMISRQEFMGSSGRGLARGRAFGSIDSDNDGLLTQSELNAATAGVSALPPFSVLDADRNGSLTEQEFGTSRVQNTGSVFRDLDTDRNGALSQTEVDAFGRR